MPTDPTTTPTTTAAARVTIRRATPADAAEVAEVEEIADLEDQATHVQVDIEQWRRLLTRPDATVLLADRGGRPIGYVSAIRRLNLWTGGDLLTLDDLYVRPGHRDAGIGRQLMATLAALAAGAAAHPLGHGGRQRRRAALLPPARRSPAAQDPRRLATGRVRRRGRRPLTQPRTRPRTRRNHRSERARHHERSASAPRPRNRRPQ
jgi:GNAT superfamily N-acetyltransferase